MYREKKKKNRKGNRNSNTTYPRREPNCEPLFSPQEAGFLGWGAQASLLRSSSPGSGSTLAAKAPDHFAPP